MDTTPFRINIDGLVIAGRKYAFNSGHPGRRLLLLHGAGVPGDLTWQFVVQYLDKWDEILVPDLPLMGRSKASLRLLPGFDYYLSSVSTLIDYFGWHQFDIGGYSFGGLLAMHLRERFLVDRLVLVEPASLSSTCSSDLLSRAEVYRALGQELFDWPDDPELYRRFLDVVSPARISNDRVDEIAIKRLMAESRGLAAGVSAVADALVEYADFYCAWQPDIRGMSFVGGLSGRRMHERHEQLADSAIWKYESIPRTDHGLIYVRPKEIARSMNGLYSCSD
ncbi:MAG: alpha/beta hydrolase [Thalassolituus sp.]